MKRMTATLLMILTVVGMTAQNERSVKADTIAKPEKRNILSCLYNYVKTFSDVDTFYIEPQKYNYTVMTQATLNYEFYTFRDGNGASASFVQEPSVKVGPFFGWRFLFLGYTLDIKHMSKKTKQELDLSLYSSQIGIDLFYKKTNGDYKINRIYDSGRNELKPMSNQRFDGIEGSMKGFNLYYILNHKKFSYPAAFSQSTIQRRSAGSPIVGIGYTKHSLKVDWDKLGDMIYEKCGNEIYEQMDSSMQKGKVSYKDINISGGYGYNWVFARNWVFDASLSMGLSYKKTTGDTEHTSFKLRDFSFNNINIDGIGRFAVVWNNMRWYVGTSAVFHTYYYRKSSFSSDTTFGNVNVYVGFNFGKR